MHFGQLGARGIACILTLLLALPLGAMQQLGASVPQIQQQLNTIGVGGRLTVHKTDGSEYHGTLSLIGTQTFSIAEVDLKTSITIQYSDVTRVEKNYGRKGFAGKRVSPRRSLIAGVVIVGGLITLVFVAVANDHS